MPSRQLKSLPTELSPPVSHRHHHHNRRLHLLPPLLAVILTIIFLSFILAVILLYRKLTRNRTAPTASPDLKSPLDHSNNQCRRFSYSLLRRATSSFSPSNKLGHGGFGSVYKAILPNHRHLHLQQFAAVKLMDPNGSLQGEREFHNELTIASSLTAPYIVSLLGFSSNPKKGKLLLVYELMENRSLQEALLDRKCEELMNWRKRFEVICHVARGLEYLHCFCDPPVIHGDIKPSNILLDSEFNAKIGDFGLARVKLPEEGEEGGLVVEEDNGSILEEVERESVVTTNTGFEGDSVNNAAVGGGSRGVLDSDVSPEVVSPEVGFDRGSVESGKDLGSNNGGRKVGGSRRDWWWKQEGNGVWETESGRVKDYVMEWIGSEINKERPKSEWIGSANDADGETKAMSTKSLKLAPKKHMKRLDWWASLDEERMKRKEKKKKPREWWKEEFCEELTRKREKKTKQSKKRGLSGGGGESWWQKEDDEFCDDVVRDRKKRKGRSSRGSIDWWLDGLSGELRNGRRNSQDWASGEIPKSGGVSSTPSMRGTVCYIAPEYGGGSQLSEKCDVYSFGVLLLVVVSGRRPLQVTASPLSEFERANLISWARQLAHNGKLLDLVDPSIHSLDKDQALLCITVALLCLQRSPSKRPTMKEIVGMLSGEGETPHLPFEFSPSPPSNFPFKSRRKVR